MNLKRAPKDSIAQPIFIYKENRWRYEQRFYQGWGVIGVTTPKA